MNEEEGYLLPTWARKITCQCFDWVLQSSSNMAKVKKCEQTLLFVAMHYWGMRHWRSKVNGNCSPSSSQQSINQGLPVLHLSWSTPLRVSSGCAGPPSPTAPVLCRGPALPSPPSRSGRIRGGRGQNAGWRFGNEASITLLWRIEGELDLVIAKCAGQVKLDGFKTAWD